MEETDNAKTEQLLIFFECKNSYYIYGMRTISILKNAQGFPAGTVDKNLPASAGDMGSVSGQGTKIPHALWPKKKETVNLRRAIPC